MNYKEIIYEKLRNLLEEKIHGWSDAELDADDDLNETYEWISILIDEISEAEAGAKNGVLVDASLKIQALSSYSSSDESWRKISVICGLCNTIEENVENLDEDLGVDLSLFKLSEYIGGALPFNSFGYFNEGVVLDSIAYMNVDVVLNYIDDDSGINSKLLVLMLNALYEIDDVVKPFVIHRADIQDQDKIIAALNMQIVLHDKEIHAPINSTVSPMLMPFALNVSCQKDYHQFSESFFVLSEMNNRKDVLGKYLSVYHLIEGFVDKIPLVHLANKNPGYIFKVRDFKVLYDNVSGDEKTALKKIFTKPDYGQALWEVDITVCLSQIM